MQILIVAPDMHPRTGGPPRVVIGHAVALAGRGHSPTVVAMIDGEEEQEVRQFWSESVRRAGGSDLPLKLFKRVRPRAAGFSPDFNRFIDQHVREFDVLHVHGVWEHCLAYAGRKAAAAGIPWLFTPHGMLDRWSRRRSKWKKRIASLVFRTLATFSRANGVHFLNELERGETSDMSLSGTPFVIGNGVFLETADKGSGGRAEQRTMHPQLAGGGEIILFHSRLHPKKGIVKLLEGFARVRPQFPGARLLVASIKQDLAYEKVVRDRAAEPDVSGSVVIEATSSGAHSFDPFAGVEIFALTSFEEGFSMAIIEAMLKGLPVLISGPCHMPIVEEIGCGVIVDPTEEGVAEGLRRLLSLTGEERKEMGARGATWVKQNCTWDSIAERLEAAYWQMSSSGQIVAKTRA
ncbi:GDP-mannose:cellobiosyl-diphosphopolyprenol alpha-mannosyltransferase [Caulifigura coniformis]|uniref:GDP-mannose:cellobiosyl-diphosphopolyprenol alpha-mannosyltransferase n=1 Tax=Caulifigura coniformis TaxID=2527983 RepID=A0A517SI80_9PLAN|nr:glycosyltransferase [Caulifigura coniformis]QDT55834.1 GDP-mannose:cellobiosyl-diphosphopolyprenol alpha-mannosyltransferase [Caulifigura coniformis]